MTTTKDIDIAHKHDKAATKGADITDIQNMVGKRALIVQTKNPEIVKKGQGIIFKQIKYFKY